MAPGLHFADIGAPGITRRLIRGHWAYFVPDGKRITNREEIDRLNAIALPPAYTDAWFAADARAHILATGIDARGRKQYRYHPDFRAERDDRKFAACAAFGRLLPQLRKKVDKDLAKRSLSAERAIASILKLLDCTHIRVGNEEYARANKSFGATTLRGRHAHLEGDRLTLKFKAKSGKICRISVRDRGLVRFVKQVQHLPGQMLFQYLDDDGEPHPVKLAGKPRALDLLKKTKTLFMLLQAKESRVITEDEDARILAMKHAILRFRKRTLRDNSAPGLGRLDLITGGLGPGGAERQLSRVAIELERARREKGKVGEIAITDAPMVVVRSHGPEKQNDFFLEDVRKGGVELVELNSAKPVAPQALGVTDPELLVLLDFLPPPVNYGVKRLAKHFIDRGTDIASAWQDGGCLFAGLAALIAGVPSIHFVMRGLPPSIRRHLFRPEYEPLYRAMAQVPGVRFFSNSHAAARAYCEWLDLSPARFSVVYNGVNRMSSEGDPQAEQMWSDFVMATQDATRTVGGVFRFDTDKQPNVWIRFAARFLKENPGTRFVLVGGGRLLEGARKVAQKLGIAERILFTGNSTTVGFWFDKMDVKVLLSRFEGLPNVLIEAQYSGVPVVTTPAGGAAECLIDGVTGRVVGRCERPDLAEVVAAAGEVLETCDARTLFAAGGEGRKYLDARFSIPGMLQTFATAVLRNPAPADEAQLRRLSKAA